MLEQKKVFLMQQEGFLIEDFHNENSKNTKRRQVESNASLLEKPSSKTKLLNFQAYFKIKKLTSFIIY